MKILYVFPSRSRPSKLIAAIENIISMAKHDTYTILVSMDVDDPTVATKSFNERLLTYEKVKPAYGFSKSKVHAVNRDIWMVGDWDILCIHSDDMVVKQEGFDFDIIEAYSDGFSGICHFPDGHVNEALNTYAIMDRSYYLKFGYVYHEDFTSVYCDNLQMDIAKKLGAYKFVNKHIIEHQHFIWGFGEKDELLLHTENPENYEKDKQTYYRLKTEMGLW